MIASLVVLVVGALVYGFAPGSGRELGRIAFFVGLFWLVYLLCQGHGLHLS